MKCRICKNDTTLFLDLGETPLADKFPSTPDEQETYYPLRVHVCQSCWLVQLEDHIDDGELFGSDYAFFTGASPSLVKHFEEYATAIHDRFRQENGKVLEIASNDGTLLKMFKDRGWDVQGVDPSVPPAEQANRNSIPTMIKPFSGALGESLAQVGKKADLVIANNVIAHVKDPVDLLKGIAAVLDTYGTAVIEFQHFKQLMERCEFDHFYHEHRSYFSLQSFQNAATEAGLRVWDVEEVGTQGGSLRVFLCHTDGVLETTPTVGRIIEEEQKSGLTDIENYWILAARVRKLADHIRGVLIGLKLQGKTVAVYGASAKSGTLLNYCEIGEHADFVEDTTPYKIGKCTPGTKIPIVAPGTHDQPDYYLLSVWNYLDGVLSRERAFREKGGKFIVPIPYPKII